MTSNVSASSSAATGLPSPSDSPHADRLARFLDGLRTPPDPSTNALSSAKVGGVGAASRPLGHGSAPKDSLTQLKEKISAPLYDFRDLLVINAAKSITPADLKNSPAEERDLIGANQIRADVTAFKAKNPHAEIVVIYSGAGVHSWGAINSLKKQGFNYISAAAQPLDSKLMEHDSLDTTSSAKQAAVKDQLITDQRVLGKLGFQNYRQFYNSQANTPTKGRDVFIGIDETGFHGETGIRQQETGRDKNLFAGVANYIAGRKGAGKQVAVLYLGEGLNASALRQDFDNGHFRPNDDSRDILFSTLKTKNIPIGFAGVTYSDSKTDGSF